MIAQTISILYLVLVIRTMPYENDMDDVLTTIASISILFTLMAGYAMRADQDAVDVLSR
jgi:hypothetical protein